jgi:hypothetical protein
METQATLDARREMKLPQWAQQEMARLRANVEHYKQEAWSATTPGVSDTFLETYGDSNNLGLPAGSAVGFRLANGHRITCRLEKDGRSLRVASDEPTLAVLSAAANLVYIKAVEDR